MNATENLMWSLQQNFSDFAFEKNGNKIWATIQCILMATWQKYDQKSSILNNGGPVKKILIELL